MSSAQPNGCLWGERDDTILDLAAFPFCVSHVTRELLVDFVKFGEEGRGGRNSGLSIYVVQTLKAVVRGEEIGEDGIIGANCLRRTRCETTMGRALDRRTI